MRRLEVAAFVGVAALAGSRPLQETASQAARLGDAPLSNEARPALSAAATELFARGDSAWLEFARAPWTEQGENARDRERLLTEAFESWRQALAASAVGEAVAPAPFSDANQPSPWPDPDGTSRRRTEGVEYALLRRLFVLPDEECARWTARFEALSLERALAAGNDFAALAQLERELPLTSGAARAALALADRSFEEGRGAAARTWLERARRHVRELATAQTPALACALELRLAALAALDPPASVPAEVWQSAHAVRRGAAVRLDQPAWSRDGFPIFSSRRPHTPRPAARFVKSGALFVRGPDFAACIDPDRPRETLTFDPERLLERRGIKLTSFVLPGEDESWTLEPAVVENDVVLVVGNGSAIPANALARIALPSVEHPGDLAPRLVWVMWKGMWFDASGRVEELSEDALIREGHFQPGPVAVGTELFVLVREASGVDGGSSAWSEAEVATWLQCVDLASGRPLWKRPLGRGMQGPLEDRSARFAREVATPAEPLLVLDGRIFSGTSTGLGLLSDVADGRLAWSFLDKKRGIRDPGWRVERALATLAPAAVHWTPADGGELYVLRGAPDLEGAGLLLAPPRAGAGALAACACDTASAIVLERPGRGAVLSRWDLVSGGRFGSLDLGSDERAAALCSPERAWVATARGLLLFDTARELTLLDFQEYGPDVSAPLPASIAARDALVAVAGPGAVVFFRAR